MIDLTALTDADIMRRVVWTIGEGVQQGAWLIAGLPKTGTVLIGVRMQDSQRCKPVEVPVDEICWLEDVRREERRIG
ncbi:MAG: hypothetical protein MSG64_17540 [Pyrinomonadaceae bacterium MAG19_C2-C3]|nr:hypothetical protein [Pyrinomonadaceae bacterium MAG19_C2-C3]